MRTDLVAWWAPNPPFAHGWHRKVQWALIANPMDTSVNAYVRVPAEGHPMSELALTEESKAARAMDDLVRVHGGWTFGPRDGWFGFDTQHAWDVWTREEFTRATGRQPGPFFDQMYKHIDSEFSVFWTVERVKEEVMNAAEIIAGWWP